jgi:hypothetical protein
MHHHLPSPVAPLAALLAVASFCLISATVQAADEQDAAVAAPTEKRVSSEQLAVEASNVQNEHCADAASNQETGGIRSISTVSDTWVRVSERYDQSGESYLLYWRGVLAQCMDQEDRALTDLKDFISRSEGNSLWATLIKDAKRRARQLGYKTAGARQSGVADPEAARKVIGFVLGASLAAGSAGSGIAAATFWNTSQDKAAYLRQTERDNLTVPGAWPEYEQGQTAARNSSILTVAAIGLGIGATVSFLVAAGTGASPTAGLLPPVIVPTSSGAVLSWGAPF